MNNWIYIYIHMHTSTYIYTYTCTYINTYMYTHILYIYTYIQTTYMYIHFNYQTWFIFYYYSLLFITVSGHLAYFALLLLLWLCSVKIIESLLPPWPMALGISSTRNFYHFFQWVACHDSSFFTERSSLTLYKIAPPHSL